MTSQIRVDEITNRSGLGTVTIYDNGFEFTGVTTFTEDVDITGGLTIGGVLTYEDVTNIDSVGVVTARGGLDVSDTGTPVNIDSTNSGLNKIHFKTGGTTSGYLGNNSTYFFSLSDSSGNQRVRHANSGLYQVLDTSGNVIHQMSSTGKIGIGTAPVGDLTVLTTNNGYVDISGSGGNGAEIKFLKKADKSQTYSIQNNGGSNELVQHVVASTSGEYSWYIGGQNTSNLKLRITSNGDVGIASVTPSHRLEVAYSDDNDGFVINNIGRGGKYRFATSGTNGENFDVQRYDHDNSTFRRYLLFGPQQFAVYTGSTTSSTERVRIDSSGNATFKYKVTIGDSYGGGEIFRLGKSSGTSYMAFHNGGANMGFIGFADQLVSGGASNQLGIRSQDAIFFATGGNTERVRLDNDRMTFAQNRRLRFAPNSSWGAGLNMGGNGNSSDTTYGSIAVTNGNLHLDARGGSGYGMYLNWYTGGAGTYFGNGSGGQAGRIDASGNLSLSGTYPGSDLRLKENIETITGATDKIKALVGKTFRWKPESGLDSYKRYGFIAQEVQQVVPDLVKAIGSHYFDANDNLVHNIEPTETDEDRESAGITKSLTVNSEGITPILVEAMKELIAKNEALEARIAALEGS